MICQYYRRGTSIDNTGSSSSNTGMNMNNQDLISFLSPPQKKEQHRARDDLESINFDNNNQQHMEKFKAVQNLFSPSTETIPPPQPLPRSILPVINPNGSLSYPNITGGPLSSNNQTQFFSNSYNQNNQNNLALSFNSPPTPSAGFIAGQSMFNQTVTRPINNVQRSQILKTLSLENFNF